MSNREKNPGQTEATSADPVTLTDSERREALRKLGTLAAWSAPVMLTLMTSARADEFGSPERP